MVRLEGVHCIQLVPRVARLEGVHCIQLVPRVARVHCIQGHFNWSLGWPD